MKKLLYIIIAILTVATVLIGCNSGTDTTAPASKGGTIYITVNPVIAVTYDEKGSVVSVTAVSEDAKAIVEEFKDYVGKECAEVVTTLVTKIGDAGYLTEEAEIIVTFKDNSTLPEENFTEKLTQKIENTVVENNFGGTVTVEPPVITQNPVPESKPSQTTSPSSDSPSTTVHSQTQPNTETTPPLTTAPGTDTTAPVPTIPDQTEPVVTIPDKTEPVVTIPDRTEPVVTIPDRTEPVVTIPDKTEPDNTYPVTTTPDETVPPVSSEPETTVPDIPDNTVPQGDGTRTVIEYFNLYEEAVSDASQAAYIRITVYSKDNKIVSMEQMYAESGNMHSRGVYNDDGIMTSQTVWYESGAEMTVLYYYDNGNLKSYNRYFENGALQSQFTSFHGNDNDNGTLIQYNESGKMTNRSVMNDPDGSPNTEEAWYDDGTYTKSIIEFAGPDADVLFRISEMLTTRTDGTEIREIFDYDAGTIRIIRTSSNGSSDILADINDTENIIEGYNESTVGNLFHRVEYKNGYKSLEITDGGTVGYQNYVVRDTVRYYDSSTQIKSSERYFYLDGGRIYTEYDKNGNVTHSERTTSANI